jgi:hypothetical protein
MKKIKLLLAFLALALIIWSGVEKGVFYKTGRKIIRYNMLNSVSEYSKKAFTIRIFTTVKAARIT